MNLSRHFNSAWFKYLVTVFFLSILITGCMEDKGKILQIGQKAPPFSLDLLDGKQTSLDQYAGKGLAITFMSSWCPCSKDSIPFFKEAYKKYKNDNIQFLMIGIQDARGKFEKIVAKWKVPFPAGYDKGDRIARDYGVQAPPTTIFIDKDGSVKRVFYGNIKDKEKEFPQWIEEIL